MPEMVVIGDNLVAERRDGISRIGSRQAHHHHSCGIPRTQAIETVFKDHTFLHSCPQPGGSLEVTVGRGLALIEIFRGKDGIEKVAEIGPRPVYTAHLGIWNWSPKPSSPLFHGVKG